MNAVIAACMCALGLLSLSGCGKQTSEVRGTVRVNGQNVTSGNIAFISDDVRLDSSVISDGAYTLLKAPVGKVKITVVSTVPPGTSRGRAGNLAGVPPEMREKAASAIAQGSSDPASGKKRIEVPKKYGDEKTTDLTYEVKSGKQEYDIDLPSK